MTFFEFMNGVYQIILDKLKEQTFAIMLLMGAIAYFYFHSQKIESKLEQKIVSVETSLSDCNAERGKLAVLVADLQARFEVFSNKNNKRK